MTTRLLPFLVAVGVASMLSACATGPTSVTDDATASASVHGAIEGASEMSEPQLGLMIVDAAGEVSQLDLLDETVSDLGAVPAPSAVATDGRYVFSVGDDGVTIIDSGRWTWDHVDHFHYYLAEPRVIGTVEGRGPATVSTTNSSTSGSVGVFFAETGEAVLLDTHALSQGRIVESFRLDTESHDGLLVPIGSFALVTEPNDGGATSVQLVDDDGMPVPGALAECADPRGSITTRVGAVVGCADGALLATVADGSVEIERIPYPDGDLAPRADAFAGREGRPTVAAKAGDAGIWLLDTRARTWTLLPASVPIVAVTAVDDDAEHVLALSSDGRLLVIDAADGTTLSMSEPLAALSLAGGSGPTLLADQSRAYISAPTEGVIYEIDFADAARIARTFPLPTGAAFVAGTGR